MTGKVRLLRPRLMIDRPRLLTLISLMGRLTRERCYQFLEDNAERCEEAWGSSHNHQAWPGGYLDHIEETMEIAVELYEALSHVRRLPFRLKDALLVMFLHDLEKPWKKELGLKAKHQKRSFREEKIQEYGFELTEEQQNALRYVEGEGDDYKSDQRVMNELAAFCHMCDIASARIWHSFGPRVSSPHS